MRIVLTGASGFLGSALATHWIDEGHEITALVRFPQTIRPRLLPLKDRINVFPVENDQDILDAVRSAKPDVIVHAACAYGRANERHLQLLDTNVRMGVGLLEAILEVSHKRIGFLNAGSILSMDLSLYALTKSQFVEWGRFFCRNYPDRLQFINLRLQHIYGPGDDVSKFTSRVIHACHRNDDELALTAGEQLRDFIYIDDAVEAFDIALHRLSDLTCSEDLDVGSGCPVKVKYFVQRVHTLLNSSTRLMFGALPLRMGDCDLHSAKTERIESLGWRSRFDLDSGLKETIKKEFSL